MATNKNMLNRIFDTHNIVEKIGSVLIFHLDRFLEILNVPIDTLSNGQWVKKAVLQGLNESMNDIKEFL
ncbi:MAG: hypothetical protein JW920_07475 [Deltaproteobacteria bacterium]|nr:hypothetical protein [Deltaproteobacteria bacterium]